MLSFPLYQFLSLKLPLFLPFKNADDVLGSGKGTEVVVVVLGLGDEKE